MKKTTSGFTIVELLIVIVVIAILAAISVVAYQGIQGRANDSKRVQDIASIRKALELYKVANGQYPVASANPGDTGWEVSTDSTFMNSLSSVTTSIPRDPKNTTTQRYYYYRYAAGANGCPVSAGPYYALRTIGLEATDGRTISDLGVCADSTTLGVSRTPTQTVAVFFGFEN